MPNSTPRAIGPYRPIAWDMVVFVTVMAIGAGTLFVLIRSAKRDAAESSCHGHVLQLVTALKHFYQRHGKFPEAVVQGEAGKPPYSWRVAILPELGYEDVYKQYNFDEPWDSPANKKVMLQMPAYYSCPNCRSEYCTSYFMVPRSGRGLSEPSNAQIDVLPNELKTEPTIIVIERNHSDIPWIEPREIDDEHYVGTPCDPAGFGYCVPGGKFGRSGE